MNIFKGLAIGCAVVGVSLLVSCKEESAADKIEGTTTAFEKEAVKLQEKADETAVEAKKTDVKLPTIGK